MSNYQVRLMMMARDLRQRGMNAEAIQCLRQLVEIDPRDAPSWFNIGNTYFAYGLIVGKRAACFGHLALCKWSSMN
jgi:tetratricopeptide (TPR) repeat protein